MQRELNHKKNGSFALLNVKRFQRYTMQSEEIEILKQMNLKPYFLYDRSKVII